MSELYLDAGASLDARTDDLMARLTLEEKVSLLAGGSSFALNAIERLGVPSLRMSDGPTGVRSIKGDRRHRVSRGRRAGGDLEPGDR